MQKTPESGSNNQIKKELVGAFGNIRVEKHTTYTPLLTIILYYFYRLSAQGNELALLHGGPMTQTQITDKAIELIRLNKISQTL